MNLLVKNNHLFVKNMKLRCAIGRNGLIEDKKEVNTQDKKIVAEIKPISKIKTEAN